MANMNKDTLKKHHFWILVGFVPLVVLLAVVMITSSVGGEIDKRQGQVKTAQTAIASKTSPKPNELIAKIEKQKDALEVKRTDLWKDNWERQIGIVTRKDRTGKEVRVQDNSRNLLRWLQSKKLDRFNYTPTYATDKYQLKFGDKIPDDQGEDQEFKKPEVYISEFTNLSKTGMVDKVAPTTFATHWSAVLRHVAFPANGPNGWGDLKPTSEQLWLALEDMWIQRALLGSVKTVNDQIATFTQVPRYDANGKPLEDAKLERAFQSRIWRVDLKAAPRPGDNRYVVTGTLRNVTDRLQLLGSGNTMTLNVWLSTDPTAQPFQFRIGGEFVPGGATLPVTPTPEHVLDPGMVPTEIARVEQVFDTRTVPVRRIDHLALGKPDSRNAAAELKLPANFKQEEPAAAPDGMGPMGMGPMGMGPMGMGGQGAAAGQWYEGAGPVATVLDGNRKRYIDVTKNVRRMPVALTLVVDQAYLEDVLMAYANCPLRFQITQVHWQRFKGPLSNTGPGGTSSGSADDEPVLTTGTGTAGGGFNLGTGGGLRPVPGTPGMPGGPGPGRGPGRPMGPMSPMFPPPTGPMVPGGTEGPGYPMTGSGYPGSTTLSEGQLTAGLIELNIYGIVSLYEKYEAKEATEAAAATP